MGPPKDYEERRELVKTPLLQRILDFALAKALVAILVGGGFILRGVYDNANNIDSLTDHVGRIEQEQEGIKEEHKEFKKIVYTRFREYDERFHSNELQLERLKIWQRKAEKP